MIYEVGGGYVQEGGSWMEVWTCNFCDGHRQGCFHKYFTVYGDNFEKKVAVMVCYNFTIYSQFRSQKGIF